MYQYLVWTLCIPLHDTERHYRQCWKKYSNALLELKYQYIMVKSQSPTFKMFFIQSVIS